MKITKEIFKENVGVGVAAGAAVSVVFYFINRGYVKAVNKIDKDGIEAKAERLKDSEKELEELENSCE